MDKRKLRGRFLVIWGRIWVCAVWEDLFSEKTVGRGYAPGDGEAGGAATPPPANHPASRNRLMAHHSPHMEQAWSGSSARSGSTFSR